MKIRWDYVFAGITALGGLWYLKYGRGQGGQQPVTNVFPPLNTPQAALPDAETGIDAQLAEPSAQQTGTQQGTQKLVPYPVYIV